MHNPEITIIEQGPILTPQDFLRLDIVDWTRIKRSGGKPREIMDSLTTWFVKTSIYHIIQTNLCDYPERDDFPQWNHSGTYHRDIAEVFWNHFHYRFPKSTLAFDDCPDFYGEIVYSSDERVQIIGDIGKVSPFGLRNAIPMLNGSSLWISVVDLNTLILIEPRCELASLNDPNYLKSLIVDLRPEGSMKPKQLDLFQ